MFDSRKEVSSEFQDVLSKLLTKEPANRITISELREHPWVLKSGRSIPSKHDNCMEEITVTDEEIKKAIQKFYTPIHILVSLHSYLKIKLYRTLFHTGNDKANG